MDPVPTSHDDAGERPPDLAVLTRVEGELAAVEQALVRLDEGTYGTCQVCGAVIGAARLAAEPATALCAEHQPA